MPAQTDAQRILAALDELRSELKVMSSRQHEHAIAVNALGENMQWIVDNVQGIFATFANPAFMSQMTSQMMGMLNGNGQQQPAAPRD